MNDILYEGLHQGVRGKSFLEKSHKICNLTFDGTYSKQNAELDQTGERPGSIPWSRFWDGISVPGPLPMCACAPSQLFLN